MTKQLTDQDTLNLLVVYIDLNPFEWGKRKLQGKQERPLLLLPQFLNHVMVFLNSYIVSKNSHKLAIIGSYLNKTQFLYPTADLARQPATKASKDAAAPVEKEKKKKKKKKTQELAPNDRFIEEYFMKEHPFLHMQTTVMNNISAMVASAQQPTDDKAKGSSLSAALSLALCFINRMERDKPLGTALEPRILALQVSPDVSAQYISVMNAIFSAQRMNVLIDSCVLCTEDSAFLQQASYITDGVYMKPLSQDGLLQYLLVMQCFDVHSYLECFHGR